MDEVCFKYQVNHNFLSNFEVPIPNYLSNWITPPSFKYHTLFEDNLITNRYGWWKKIQHTKFFRICRFNQCTSQIFWLVVSIPLKNISQNGNLPQIGVNIKIFETTTQSYASNAAIATGSSLGGGPAIDNCFTCGRPPICPSLVGRCGFKYPLQLSWLTSLKQFAPENWPGPKRKGPYSNHPFSGAFAVSFREATPWALP